MRSRIERIWPPRVLKLTGTGLRRGWRILAIAWLVLSAINIGALELPIPVEGAWAVHNWRLARSIAQMATTTLVGGALVVWMIERMEPAALGGERPLRRLPLGWAASLFSNLLIQTPSLMSSSYVMLASPDTFTGYAYLVQGGLGLLASVWLGYALGEALTRRIGPLRALMASVRVTRGNRIALLLLMVVIHLLLQGVTAGAAALTSSETLGEAQWALVTAAQALASCLATVLLTAVYLELRRVHRALEPEGISETFD